MKEIRKKEEVERFLKQFLPKLDIWGIIYIDREKNDAALKAMGITPNARGTVIRSIETDDYVETISISFHESEHAINYAFKNKEGGK